MENITLEDVYKVIMELKIDMHAMEGRLNKRIDIQEIRNINLEERVDLVIEDFENKMNFIERKINSGYVDKRLKYYEQMLKNKEVIN